MKLDEWRKKRASGDDVELPSGLTVQARKFTVMDLAMSGEVPKELDAVVIRFANGNQAVGSTEEMAALGTLINLVGEKALIGPDGLEIDELPGEDRQFLFQWCHGAGRASASGSFRDRQNGAVGAAPDGGDIRTATEHPAED